MNEMKIFSKKIGLDILKLLMQLKLNHLDPKLFIQVQVLGGTVYPLIPIICLASKKNNFNLNLIKISGEINRMMPKWIVKFFQ